MFLDITHIDPPRLMMNFYCSEVAWRARLQSESLSVMHIINRPAQVATPPNVPSLSCHTVGYSAGFLSVPYHLLMNNLPVQLKTLSRICQYVHLSCTLFASMSGFCQYAQITCTSMINLVCQYIFILANPLLMVCVPVQYNICFVCQYSIITRYLRRPIVWNRGDSLL